MTKIQELKKAMKTPPPERLAKIEYQSHFLQIIGVGTVCVILTMKGFWYIIFAFIFSFGISYSQGMTAYHKYITIMSLVHPEKMEDFEKDISPTRRRSKIIKSVMGGLPKATSIVLAVGLAMMIIDPTLSRWLLVLLYPLTILITFLFLYFFLFYWICYPMYKKKIKKEKELK